MNAARQMFERGMLFWFDFGDGVIFAIANLDEGLDDEGQSWAWWEVFADEWDGKSEPPGQAPEGLLKPERGFGHVWGTHSEVWARLGWATHAEQAGQGECELDSDAWCITFADDFSARLEHPPAPEPEPEPEPQPPQPTPDPVLPSPTPEGPLPLHEQANYHMVLLPNADTPLIMWNLSSFLYLNLRSDGRVVGELRRPIAGIDLPPEIEIDERDGRWIVWFAGEYARGLWAHLLRVAYRPFIPAVDGQ